MSGYGGNDTRQLFGSDISYVQKPWDLDQLPHAVLDFLDC